MTPLERYEKLREEHSRLEKEQARAEGALGEVLQRLRDEHGLASLEEAGEWLERAGREQSRLERELEKEMDRFEAEWGERLSGES